MEAKCAHGVVLQIAEDTLCRIDDKEPITNIKWDRRELLNLYAALARELRAAQSARPNTRHSKDFSSVLWFGVPYSFSRAQAGCVKVLWESWEQDTPEIRGEAIVDAIDASTDRTLPRIFTERGKRHQAWGTMIVPGTLHKGTYRLQEPKPPLQKKTRKTPSSPLK